MFVCVRGLVFVCRCLSPVCVWLVGRLFGCSPFGLFECMFVCWSSVCVWPFVCAVGCLYVVVGRCVQIVAFACVSFLFLIGRFVCRRCVVSSFGC